MGRRFVGIDASAVAVETMRTRFDAAGTRLSERDTDRLGVATA
jgi:hypothetical protein